MFNHVRTLLLNVSGSNTPGAAAPGEEGVPADFRAVPLSAGAAACRNALFGARPDRLMLNYRLRQYMTLLHATELDEHVRAFDPRITYDPRGEDLPAGTFGVTAEGSALPIHFAGAFRPDDALGRLEGSWRVSVNAGGTTATVRQESLPSDERLVPFTVSDGVSSDVGLGRGLRCFFVPTPGAVWHVTARARPARTLAQIVEALRQLGEGRVLEVFGGGSAEPFRTYRNLWQSHPFLPYRLGGLLMALARRTHEAWRKET